MQRLGYIANQLNVLVFRPERAVYSSPVATPWVNGFHPGLLNPSKKPIGFLEGLSLARICNPCVAKQKETRCEVNQLTVDNEMRL